jgi:hypothetical protein
MRAPLLLLTAVLTLSACKNNDQHDNTMNVDENLSAENIVSNDVTAIDAVTGDAANMAADVDMNYGNLDQNDSGNVSAAPKPKPETDSPKGSTSTSKPAPSPVENTPANSVSNGA